MPSRATPLFVSVALVAFLAGCGFGDVVRVGDGRVRSGRFVPDVAYAASLEAGIAEAREDWPGAVEALRKARDADPSPEIAARLGAALCRLGKREDAMRAFEDALADDPAHERAYTERGRCRLLPPKADPVAARADFERGVSADPEALPPALSLVALDLAAYKLGPARARIEEAVLLHPGSAVAWRTLAEVAAHQGDAARAVGAARVATALDDDEGRVARESSKGVADLSGVAAWSIVVRTGRLPDAGASPISQCGHELRVLSTIAARAPSTAVSIAADAIRITCPEAADEATRLELVSAWSPSDGDAVEARALASTSLVTRRWGARMRLRHLPLAAVVLPSLPKVEDRSTLALHLAAIAIARPLADAQALALTRAAFELAPDEPTVARLSAEVARRAGEPQASPLRTHACRLARTDEEKKGCAK